MITQAKNRLTMSKGAVTAKREPSSSGLYSWAWVIPLQDGRFRIRVFEVSQRLVDDDICFNDDDMNIVHDEIVDEISEVDDVVAAANVDPEKLDAPWKNDFPL